MFIKPTGKTPQIDFNRLTGELILSGRSIPENATEFYEDVLKWIIEYVTKPRHTTNLRLNLDYFNTSSSIWLVKIIKTLCSTENSKYTLIIHLYFNIEEFDNMEVEELKEALSPIIDIIGTPTMSVGIKIYGTGSNGEILKESMVLI